MQRHSNDDETDDSQDSEQERSLTSQDAEEEAEDSRLRKLLKRYPARLCLVTYFSLLVGFVMGAALLSWRHKHMGTTAGHTGAMAGLVFTMSQEHVFNNDECL